MSTSEMKSIEVNVKGEGAFKKDPNYVIKNPNSTGCKTCFSGGMTLNEWDIEDEQFYEGEGKQIAARNLWASIPNLLMGFGVWLMWSVVIGKIQNAHKADPSVYYFKDFAPSFKGVSEGFRGCPGWWDDACCETWNDPAKATDFTAWVALQGYSTTYANADEFMYSLDFKALLVYKEDNNMGFSNWTVATKDSGGRVHGCKVSKQRNLDYKATTYVIGATAGLSGGIFRLPNSFLTPLVGGRNVVFFTSILLAIPCFWMAITLNQADTPALPVVLAAMFSGVGGGAFASSMANINTFFPKRRAGYALGMNGGLGNLGVSLVQLLVGNVLMAYGAAGDALGGTWIPAGGWFLFPFCVVFALVAFLFMNNLPKSEHPIPDNYLHVLLRYVSLQGPAYLASGLGIVIIFYTKSVKGGAAIALTIGTIAAVAFVEHVFIWFLSTPAAKPKLRVQAAIFKEKHNYWMTYLYIMTFGSFIGFSSAFPKLIMDIFDEYGAAECAEMQEAGTLPIGDCSYDKWPVTGFSPAFLGALIGSLLRPIGGIMSDKWGGAKVTHYHTILMTVVTGLLGVFVRLAREADRDRASWFPWFLICFLLLFYGTGVGNGSTFRQIAVIFDKTLAPPVLGWSSAIASFGAFLIPKFFAIAIQNGSPETPFFIFCGYYFTCILVNWWFYFRKGAEAPC